MASIKLIIFDLDGVLVQAKNMHFDALNEALSEVNPGYKIDWSEHLNKYDGLKTFQLKEEIYITFLGGCK